MYDGDRGYVSPSETGRDLRDLVDDINHATDNNTNPVKAVLSADRFIVPRYTLAVKDNCSFNNHGQLGDSPYACMHRLLPSQLFSFTFGRVPVYKRTFEIRNAMPPALDLIQIFRETHLANTSHSFKDICSYNNHGQPNDSPYASMHRLLPSQLFSFTFGRG
ncbi:hypothetical protein RRG08_029576 [Elysia crispata]|uniref:Uncharacterized protein n=1 Tax=Elysia crispata TaxID=231223 RepID=A0AAE0YWT4_9GAST|nr:hypothetical protein RRG08_029576 [Elysia crispata]